VAAPRLESDPLVAKVGFVETYAVGPGAVQRVEDSHTALAMLLQEGYQAYPRARRPSRLVLEAIITTIFGTVYHRARASGNHTKTEIAIQHWRLQGEINVRRARAVAGTVPLISEVLTVVWALAYLQATPHAATGPWPDFGQINTHLLGAAAPASVGTRAVLLI
jgi:hypothetical protein